MSDFSWEAANDEYVPDDSPMGEKEYPPVGSWVVVQVSGQENEKLRPQVVEKETRDTQEKYKQFSVGMLVVGGDEKCDEAKHIKSCLWYRAGLSVKDEPSKLNGKLTALINTSFATGVGADLLPTPGEKLAKPEREAKEKARSAARWAASKPVLTAAVKENGFDKQYETFPEVVAAAFCAALAANEARYAIVKIGKNDYKNAAGENVKGVQPMSVTDYTTENMERLGLQLWDDTVPPPAGTQSELAF